jgi:acetyltransferase-like isoleucine patch superfamily enzyme
MKYKILRAPHINANDLTMVVVKWEVNSSDFVEKGNEICAVETTKTALDIESPYDGYVHHMVKIGDHVKVGEPLAYIFENYDIGKIENMLNSGQDNKSIISKKAKALMDDYGLSINDFKKNTIISSDTVVAKIRESKSVRKTSPHNGNIDNIKINSETIAIYCEPNLSLLAVDACKDNNIVVLVDNDNKIGRINSSHVELLPKLVKKGLKKIFIHKEGVLFYKNVIQTIESSNLKFLSIIHPSAQVSRLSTIGESVFIGSNVVVGPQVQIGNNCKVLSSSSIAHHSVVGENVTIADGCCLGGNVFIDNNSNLGLSVTVNRWVKIGKNCQIVSGVVVVDHVSNNSTLRL